MTKIITLFLLDIKLFKLIATKSKTKQNNLKFMSGYNTNNMQTKTMLSYIRVLPMPYNM